MTNLTILSSEIRQHNSLYSLNDLHKAAGSESKHQPSNFVRREETKDLIAELNSSNLRSLEVTTGRNGGTYVCKELVYSYAMWISAKFSLLVIRAFDALQSSSNPLQLPNHITDAQAGELATLIAERFPDGKDRAYAWGRFNNHFRLSGYKTLPASKFNDACAYIPTIPLKREPVPSGPSLIGRRFIVSYGHDGKESIRPVPADAYVLSPEEFLVQLNQPCGIEVSTSTLAEFVAIASRRLAQQCEAMQRMKAVSK